MTTRPPLVLRAVIAGVTTAVALAVAAVPAAAGPSAGSVGIMPADEPNYFHVVPKSTPTLDDRRVFFGSDSGVFWALEQDTGAVAWSLAKHPSAVRLRKVFRDKPGGSLDGVLKQV